MCYSYRVLSYLVLYSFRVLAYLLCYSYRVPAHLVLQLQSALISCATATECWHILCYSYRVLSYLVLYSYRVLACLVLQLQSAGTSCATATECSHILCYSYRVLSYCLQLCVCYIALQCGIYRLSSTFIFAGTYSIPPWKHHEPHTTTVNACLEQLQPGLHVFPPIEHAIS